MSETLEQIVRDLHKQLPMATQEDAIEFARCLVAALGAQEPAGHYCVSYFRGCVGMANTDFQPSIDFAEGTHALYAAPVVNPDWQMVPKEPTPEMIDQGARGMASFDVNSIWPDSWDKLQVRGMRHDASKAWRYMLAAAPEYKP